MQEIKVYKRTYRLPGKPQTIYYTIKLPHGVHRTIWAGTPEMSWESSAVYRWLTTNEPIDPSSNLQIVIQALGGTSGTPEAPKAVRGIVVVDCTLKKKKGRRKKST